MRPLTLSNLCLIAPVSLLVMVIWELLNVISGQESSMQDHAVLFICGTVVMFIIVFLSSGSSTTKLILWRMRKAPIAGLSWLRNYGSYRFPSSASVTFLT